MASFAPRSGVSVDVSVNPSRSLARGTGNPEFASVGPPVFLESMGSEKGDNKDLTVPRKTIRSKWLGEEPARLSTNGHPSWIRV